MKRRSRKGRLPYMEGTWFAVPLAGGAYVPARVARHAPKGRVLVAYFFGCKFRDPPALAELQSFQPEEAIKVVRIGDLGLIGGAWPVIGDAPQWDRDRWPMPTFIRKDDLSRVGWRVIYSDSDPTIIQSEQRIPYETTGLESGGLYGTKAVEIVLSELLQD